MKRLIVKYNRVIHREEMDKIEAKAQKEWKEKEAVFIPECCDYEIIDDGVNEAAIWLDQEIEKRKAAVEDSRKFKICNRCFWDEYKDGYHPNGNPCDSCIDCRNYSPKEFQKAVNGNVKQRGTNVPLQQTVPPMPNIVSKIDNSDEIKVGDVVKHFNSLGIVVKTNKYHVCVLTVDRNYITVDKMNLDKTGRNFPQIEKILEQIEHEDRQSKD